MDDQDGRPVAAAARRLPRWEITSALVAQRVIGIVRAADAETASRTVDALVEGGLQALEVSLTTPGALDVVREMSRRHPSLLIGAGTVLDEASARLAVLAGARFLVSPALEPAVLRVAHRYGVVAVPGAGTPTEVVRAMELGADLVKLFPASSHGARAVADLLQALPQAPLVPTGGVSTEDAPDYVRAGAVAVGMGGSLASGGPEQTSARVQDLLRRLAEAAG
jgi:2-dehydro-3-deoxyphosphogluconate aldolase/(4S)-4-hydroxy-2-oxoglutarate aldolase